MKHAMTLMLSLLPATLNADQLTCADETIQVVDAGEYSERMCSVASAAAEELRACNLTLDQNVTIRLSRNLGEVCVGLYHCGEGQIEISHPDVLAERIEDSSLFSALDVMTYFDSIIFHELVHAAFDSVPCPFAACPATSEYLAYGLQLRALSEEDREKMGLGTVPGEKVSRDAINAVMVYWAPDRFAVKAWSHLMQRPDTCDYVKLIADGAIRFDYEHP